MKLGIHYCGRDGDHAGLFDYACSGPVGRVGNESGKVWWAQSLAENSEQEQWLALSPALVPGPRGTWQFWNNPVGLDIPVAKKWRLPECSTLYDLGNRGYAMIWWQRAADWADDLNQRHGARIRGVFATDWMTCIQAPPGIEPAMWAVRVQEFCRIVQGGLHSRGYRFGVNCAYPVPGGWPGNIDLAMIEHCSPGSEDRAIAGDIAADPKRTFRLAVHLECDSTESYISELQAWRGALREDDVGVISQLDLERLGIDPRPLVAAWRAG